MLLAGSAIVTGACHDDSSTTGPSARPDVPELRQEPQGISVDPLIAHARAIPGFGGFFLDGSGRPTVYLKDTRQRGRAEVGLAGTLRQLGAAPAQLRVLQGDYEYLQLNDWFTRAAPQALAIPGAVFVDVDEGSNRLRLGVETAAAESSVRGVLARLAIPSAAVVVERAEPFHFAATLRDKVTPRRGGLQISGAGTCTLGFNTFHAAPPLLSFRSFITNSHCTNVRGGVDGTQFHQPLASNLIGTEVADPPFFTFPLCPSGRRCRMSDAARVRYASGVGSDLGGIARPTSRSLADGPVTINAANPFFNITSELSPFQGLEVNKVGSTTGWTKSRIASTCSGINVTGTNITYFCQSRTIVGLVPGVSRGGDSGSPVFYWNGGSNVALMGILWGGNSSNTSFGFSPMSGIEAELGALRTF